MMLHDRREAGSVPSCSSLALPAKVMVSPAFQLKSTAGEAMTGMGGVFPAPPVTGPTAADSAVVLPAGFVAAICTRRVAPWSASWGDHLSTW